MTPCARGPPVMPGLFWEICPEIVFTLTRAKIQFVRQVPYVPCGRIGRMPTILWVQSQQLSMPAAKCIPPNDYNIEGPAWTWSAGYIKGAPRWNLEGSAFCMRKGRPDVMCPLLQCNVIMNRPCTVNIYCLLDTISGKMTLISKYLFFAN